MAQTWTDDTFAAGHVAQTDLQNMENNFAALKSSFSGAAQPAGAVAGMPWFDSTQKVLKTRDNANAAWLGLFHGSVDSKILVYDDDVLDGYARDAGVIDKVIALKGGATYVAGGATAGSWTIGGITAGAIGAEAAHTHPLQNSVESLAATTVWNASSPVEYGVVVDEKTIKIYTGTGGVQNRSVLSAVTAAGTSHTHAGSTITQDGTARIAAAVVILVYLDLV